MNSLIFSDDCQSTLYESNQLVDDCVINVSGKKLADNGVLTVDDVPKANIFCSVLVSYPMSVILVSDNVIKSLIESHGCHVGHWLWFSLLTVLMDVIPWCSCCKFRSEVVRKAKL